MKTFQTETYKQKIWLDSNVMISLEQDGSISAILFKKGFFYSWNVVNESTNQNDLSYVRKKIEESWGKSIRTMSSISRVESPNFYRQIALNSF